MAGPYIGMTVPWLDDIFHPLAQVAMVEEKVDPYLFMSALIPEQKTKLPVARQLIDGENGSEVTPLADPLARKAPIRTLGSEFREVKVSPISSKFFSMDNLGVMMSFQENILDMDYINMISRTQDRVAQWMAAQFNYETLKRVVNNFSLTVDGNNTLQTDHFSNLSYATSSGGANGIIYGTVDSGYEWDGSSAEPLWDAIQMRNRMLNQGSGISYELDTILCPTEVFEYVRQDLENRDVSWQLSPWGGRSSMTIPAAHNITFVETRNYDGLPTNYIFGMARGRRPATTWVYDNETGFKRWSKDSRFYTYQYMDNDTHDLHTQIWTKRRTINEVPKAIIAARVTV